MKERKKNARITTPSRVNARHPRSRDGPHSPKTDSPLFAVSAVRDVLVLRPTTSAGAYVSSAHAAAGGGGGGGSVGGVGLRMIWQSFSCSRERKNPPFRRGLGHWRAEE